MSYFYKPFQSLLFMLTLVVMPAISLATPVSIIIDGVTYTADDSNVSAGAAATAYDSGFGTSVSLLETITIGGQSYAVTTIGFRAFENKGITAVSLPNNLISIGGRAFYNNSLTSVVIPNNVTVIDYDAFNINGLTSVTIGASVTTIGHDAFANNNLTSVTIGASVTTIGHDAFANNNLTSVTIGAGVTTIGDYAFKGNNLTSIIIPASVTFIDNYAFANNPLTEVWFDGNAPSVGSSPPFGYSSPTVYYNCAATGFTPPFWNGYPLGACFNKIDFDSQGGNAISEQRVLSGNSATEPTPPARSGYTFDGWYHDTAGTMPYDFSFLVDDNLTLFAQWTANLPPTSVSKIPTLSKSALIGLFGVIALLGIGLLRHNRGRHY